MLYIILYANSQIDQFKSQINDIDHHISQEHAKNKNLQIALSLLSSHEKISTKVAHNPQLSRYVKTALKLRSSTQLLNKDQSPKTIKTKKEHITTDNKQSPAKQPQKSYKKVWNYKKFSYPSR